MYINEENLSNTIKILNEHFSKENTDTIANVEFPKEIKYKSNEWLLYIFYSCLLDYGMRSIVYHNNLINTYHNFPYIFNPQYVVKNFNDDKETLFNIIKDNIHPRYPNVAVNKWLKLSVFLNQYEILTVIAPVPAPSRSAARQRMGDALQANRTEHQATEVCRPRVHGDQVRRKPRILCCRQPESHKQGHRRLPQSWRRPCSRACGNV